MILILFIILAALTLTPWVNGPIALLMGFVFAQIFENPIQSKSKKITNYLLKTAVVGLGFGMNFNTALKASSDGFLLTIVSITSILLFGYIIGRKMGINRNQSCLLSSGTAICGGSAIAAIAPVVNATEEDTSLSLATIFFLNSIALILFPFIGDFLQLTQEQFGLWSAIAIHDTSSVVGAAEAFGEEALKIATTVKLARALWIIPVSIFASFVFKGQNKEFKIPYFIGLFILAILANTYIPSLESISPYIWITSRKMLVLTLFLIGSSISIKQIKVVGLRPMFLGVLLWTMISIGSLLWILYLI